MVFRLFGLVLGMAIAVVLTGFARLAKARFAPPRYAIGKTPVRLHVGWLTPLLGLLVLVDQTSFWITAYELRDIIPFGYLTLLAVLAVIGLYFVVGTLVFPDDFAIWPNLDAWYDRSGRWIAAGMLAVNAITLAYILALVMRGAALPPLDGPGGPVLLEALFLPLLAGLTITRKRRIALILLIALNLVMLARALWPLGVAGTPG